MWMAVSAVAIPVPNRCGCAWSRGPRSAIARRRLGPSTYSLTMYGSAAATSAAITRAVQKPATRSPAASYAS